MKVRFLLLSIATLLLISACGRPALAQIAPDEHEEHHAAPSATPITPGSNQAAPAGTGGMADSQPEAAPGGGMGAGLGEMMKQMGTPPRKELYPSLMALPNEVTPEERAGIEQLARERMKAGAALLSSGPAAGGACMRIGPPSTSDWRELMATFRYNLGLASVRPAYGRFTYWEKMEYWALAWGTVVMVATGLGLWFETPFLNRFPYWALDLFRTVHFFEAILATLAIVVWRFYATIVNPEVFPLNRAMTRGTLTYEEMRRDHPLDIHTTLQRKEDDRGSS